MQSHLRKTRTFRPEIEALESRLVLNGDPVIDDTPWLPPTGIYFNNATNEIDIVGSSQDDKAEISQSVIPPPDINSPALVITFVTLGHYEDVNGQKTFVVNDTQMFLQPVFGIHFAGYAGDDEFVNNSNIPSIAFGGAGDDDLRGGAGHDELHGDADNDRLYGNGGPDDLDGGTGHDALYTGAGDDSADGGPGDDVIVTIGGNFDTVAGGLGSDSFWVDPTDLVTDPSDWELANGHLHQVAEFMSYTIDGGAPIVVSKNLIGQSLADPLAVPDQPGLVLENFADKPLFASGGPSKDDIYQGSVGDCYYVATLSAIADANPDYIKQMVVDLGDGSYGVRFYKNGLEVYVRVDADFWTDGGMLKYAKLGVEGALWGPVVEKAYAFFRKGQGTYASIASGDGTLPEHLNLTRTTWVIDDGVTAEDVLAWYQAGSPDGAIKDAIHDGVVELLTWVHAQLLMGKAVTTGARAGLHNGMAIQLDDPSTPDANESTYRRGQHVYMIDSVQFDGNGNPTGMLLRNPYGSYPLLTDFTRIYFLIGRATAWDVEPKLGLVYDGGFDFAEQEINPIGPWDFEDLLLPLRVLEPERTLVFRDYRVEDIAGEALLQDLALRLAPETTTSEEKDPLASEEELFEVKR